MAGLKPDNSDFDSPQKSGAATASNRKAWIRIFRWAVMIAVLIALAWTVWKSVGQLQEAEFNFREVQYGWWLIAIGCYILTMELSCHFWITVLRALGQHPDYSQGMGAFFASQLAKYIPGKAMVVVVRTDMIRGPEVKTSVAAASVFVETLTWIFVGSTIASLILIFQFKGQTTLQVTAAVLTVCAGVLTWPSVFRAIAGKLGVGKAKNSVEGGENSATTGSSNFNAESKASAIANAKANPNEARSHVSLQGLNLTTMSQGWFLMTIGWMLNGLSLWFVIRGLPGTDISSSDYLLTLVCVSLATVAGFVSLLPGGLGVRELVMIPLLGSRFGGGTALIATVAIRVVWLASELTMSGIIGVWRRLSGRAQVSNDLKDTDSE